jgi:hypothetical protein
MNEIPGLSRRDSFNIKLLMNKYYNVIFNYFDKNDEYNPKDIDFIRLYFCLDEMKIITVYSKKGSKCKYDAEGADNNDSQFADSLDYLMLCNLEIDKFRTWSEFIENYDDLEFTYGDRIKYLNNFIQVEHKNEIKLLRLDYLGL